MRLIDADAVLKAIDDFPYGYRGMIRNVVDNVPTVDAVAMVRCKDCKHFVRSEGVCKLLSNNYEPPVYVDDDDFCSRGERRSE